MKKILGIVLCFAAGFVFAADIHMAGDSTMANYDERESPMWGWGQALPELCIEGIAVKNHAKTGAALTDFRQKNRWGNLLKDVRPGDFVIIQFGHNDQKAAANPETGPEKSLATYKNLLKMCIDDVRRKQANPVVVTSIVRCTYDAEGRLADLPGLRTYCEAAMQVARENEVPVIDLNKISREKVTAMGKSESEKLYMVSVDDKDRTHLRDNGARAYASWFVEALKAEKLPLTECFK